MRKVRGEPRLVSYHHHEAFAIGCRDDGVRSVLSPYRFQPPNHNHFVKLVIVIGIKKAEYTRARLTPP